MAESALKRHAAVSLAGCQEVAKQDAAPPAPGTPVTRTPLRSPRAPRPHTGHPKCTWSLAINWFHYPPTQKKKPIFLLSLKLETVLCLEPRDGSHVSLPKTGWYKAGRGPIQL